MKYLLYVLLLIVSGCSGSAPMVLPDKNNLSTATVNHSYHEIIEVKGGGINESSISVSIVPKGSGLIWNPEEIKYSLNGEEGMNKNYHRIILSGIPKKSGEYSVVVSGFTLGTMYSGKDFYKKYTVKINR